MLQGLLERAQQQVAQRASTQAGVRARQSFLQESQRLLLWAESVQAQLRSEEEMGDVASAQRLLTEHQDLLEEIHLQQARSGQEGGQGVLQDGRGLWGWATQGREAGSSVSSRRGAQAGVWHGA